jgi:type IV pilus assembly protein PilN
MEDGWNSGRAAFLSLNKDMRFNINLASQPYEDAREFWTYWGTGLALLFLTTLLLVFLAVTGFMEGSKDRQDISKLKTQLAAFDQEKNEAQAMLNRPENREIRDQSKFLNDLFERKAFSWTLVFEQLEQVMPAHLHVISIQPNVSEDNNLELKLVVGGDTRDQALDLVRKMENSKHFKETRIDSERYEDQQNSGKTDRVQFDITALYIPVAGRPVSSGGMN